MSKKTNFKKISIIVAILLALLLIIKIKDKKQGDRSFKAFVVKVDTAAVNNITIVPKGENEKLVLKKEQNEWMLQLSDKKVQASSDIVQSLLDNVANMKTKSVAATSKNKWADYEVTDSTGTRVTIGSGKKELSDFIVGKFSYKQPQEQNSYMQKQNVQMSTYVRLYDEKEVYAVDGYLSMMMNRGKEAFRSNTLIASNTSNWKQLAFSYPADSSFTMVNQNGKWMINGLLADSVAVATYLPKIGRLTANGFDNAFNVNNAQPEFSVNITGDNINPIEIKAYRNSLGELVYTSSQNKGNVLKSESILSTLFVGKDSF